MNLFWAFAILVCCVAPVRAEDARSIPELTKALRSELRSELVAGLEKGSVTGATRLARLESLLVEGLPAEALEAAPFSEVGLVLQRIDALSESAKARELAKQLHERLRAQDERKRRALREAGEKLLGEAKQTMRGLAQTMLKAEKAADLDEPLRTLLRLKQNAAENSPKDPPADEEPTSGDPQAEEDRAAARARDAAQAVVNANAEKLSDVMELWQELLVAAASEKRDPRGPMGDIDTGPGKNTVQRLTFALSNAWPAFEGDIDRSAALERIELLRKQAVPPPLPPFDEVGWSKAVQEVIGKIRDLREIEPALKSIEELAEKHKRGTASQGLMLMMSSPIMRLQAMDKAYKELEAGRRVLLARTSEFMGLSSERADTLAPLREKLLRRIVPPSLGTGAEPFPENETIEAYALRQAVKAKAERDWQKLGDAYYILWVVYAQSKEQGLEFAAARSLTAAEGLERAGQVSLAVADYLRAIRTGMGQDMLDWTAARLNALKEQSPGDYERGESLVDAPRRTVERILKEHPEALRPQPGDPAYGVRRGRPPTPPVTN